MDDNDAVTVPLARDQGDPRWVFNVGAERRRHHTPGNSRLCVAAYCWYGSPNPAMRDRCSKWIRTTRPTVGITATISNEIALVSARPRPMKKMISPVYDGCRTQR